MKTPKSQNQMHYGIFTIIIKAYHDYVGVFYQKQTMLGRLLVKA